MQLGSKSSFVALVFTMLVSPAFGSIQGTYSGNFLTGKQGGAAYSYIHKSTSAKKNGNANYNQYAGGKVLFAIDNRDGISFSYNDLDSDMALSEDDTIDLDIKVDLLKFDGSLNSANTLLDVVATLTLKGSLTVGGTSSPEHSSSFTNGIRNITASDTSSSFAGLDYTVEITSDFSIGSHNFLDGDVFSGDSFFQSGALAGPFNGISFNDTTKTLSFAVWGDSRNMDGRDSDGVGISHNTGTFDPVGNDPAYAKKLGFDIFIEAAMVPPPGQDGVVPEAASVVVWGLLSCVGLIALRGRRGVSF